MSIPDERNECEARGTEENEVPRLQGEVKRLELELREIRRAFAWYMDGELVGDMTTERCVRVWDDVRDKLGLVVPD